VYKTVNAQIMQPAYNECDSDTIIPSDKLLERMKSLRGKGWEFFFKKKGQRVLRPKSRNYDFFFSNRAGKLSFHL